MIKQQADIKTCLDQKFIKTDSMAEMLGLAFNYSMNVMLYGPPGYGKSEMVKAVIEAAGLDTIDPETGKPQSFIKTLNIETDVAELLGGMDIARYRESNQVWYNCDDSFMAYPVVVLEEFADCPPSTLATLKDILTAKRFRNGSQQYDLKTNVVIGITNHKPESVADLGDWAKAILDRFPIRGEIYWQSHAKDDYLELFAKISPQAAPEVINHVAELSEQSGLKGAPISPRVASNAIETCDGWYKEVEDPVARQNLEYLSPLRYLPEYAVVVNEMNQRIAELQLREKATAEMKTLNKMFIDARSEFKKITNDENITVGDRHVRMSNIKTSVQGLMSSVSALAVPDDMTEDRSKLLNKMTELVTDADNNMNPLSTYQPTSS